MGCVSPPTGAARCVVPCDGRLGGECSEPRQAPVVQCDAVHWGGCVVERRGRIRGQLLGGAGSNDGGGRRRRDVVKTLVLAREGG